MAGLHGSREGEGYTAGLHGSREGDPAEGCCGCCYCSGCPAQRHSREVAAGTVQRIAAYSGLGQDGASRCVGLWTNKLAEGRAASYETAPPATC